MERTPRHNMARLVPAIAWCIPKDMDARDKRAYDAEAVAHKFNAIGENRSHSSVAKGRQSEPPVATQSNLIYTF